MPGAFTQIDLSQLPPPSVIENLDYEAVLAAMLADLRGRYPAFDALVESDPAYKLLEVCAWRETILRQRINDAARAVMLATASGADLDQLAAIFGVERLVVDPGDPDALPPIEPTLESDAALRRRTQLALEGFSTAGPVGAYLFHALGAHGDVLDASVQSPNPGEVLVTVLSRSGDGTPAQEVLDAVEAALSADDVRPLCDTVSVQAPTVAAYTIEATLVFYSGPDKGEVMAAAQTAGEAYAEAQHRLGRDVTLSGVYAALHCAGVQRVELTSPAATLGIGPGEASWCTAIVLTDGGIDE